MDRRGILKLFGAGASIVPLSGSTPIIEAAARLVEAPKVELITAGSVKEALLDIHRYNAGRRALAGLSESSPAETVRITIEGRGIEVSGEGWIADYAFSPLPSTRFDEFPRSGPTYKGFPPMRLDIRMVPMLESK